MVMATGSTDESLMIAVREGASEALETLFDRHHLALYEFFYRMTGDRATGESLVQDVFYRILKFRDTFRDESRFKSWLYRIARNSHHAAFRKQAPVPVFKDDANTNRTVSSARPDGAKKNKSQSVRDALLKLPEDRRELVVLSQYHHLATDEIAELLDIDVPAAKVAVLRAMMELQDLYRNLTG